ncbi:MAG: hypothetical protein JSV90_03735 [Methanobacteriota archaeon]|nr:MAG: hypothetical protein JSV90_03735 [Euryarchaeota archaeon]
MRIVQVRCPSCNTPIMSKQKDRFFHCDKCNVLHVRDGGTRNVDYEIAEFSDSAPLGERLYVPFWRLYCSFVIRSKSVEGGYAFRLASWIKGSDDGGSLFIYVPAADFDTMTFKRLAIDFTVRSPNYRTRLNFGGVRRMPARVSSEEASELADFVVVTMEAEKPGVLQRLDYSLTVLGSKIVYLPFVSSPSGLVPAL